MNSIKQQQYFLTLQAHIAVFDNADNWNENGRRCKVCLKGILEISCETPVGCVCIHCAETVYRDFADKQEIAAWHYSRFIRALSGDESLRWRLTTLSRYAEAVHIAEKQKSFEVDAMHRLLVLNLGCLTDHPLNQMVRQGALNAAVLIGKPILPMLLAYRENQNPWQFYFNIVLCASLIAPDDKRVQKLLEEAANHPLTEVRIRIIPILSGHKSVWARNLLKQLTEDTDLTGRAKLNATASVLYPPAQQSLFATEQSTANPIPDELSPLETAIIDSYPIDGLKAIYSRYLSSLFQETDFQAKGAVSVNKLKKRQLVWALAQVFSRKDLFDKLLSLLPHGVIQVLNRLTWEKGGHAVQSFTEPLDPPILIQSEEMWNGRSRSIETFNPCYTIIPVQKNYGYRSFASYGSHTTIMFLPEIVRGLLKNYLPPPEGYHLTGLDAIGKTDFIYEDGNQILRQIHLLCTYIGQGNLKYSKNTAKILKTSAKEMAAYCHIHEFYVEKNPDLEHLNTGLIIDFLQNQLIKETQGAPEFLKQVFDGFFMEFDPHSGYRLNHLLLHLKGIHNLQNGYHEQSHREKEQTVRASLRNLLRALQPGLWYSVHKLLDYCHYREIDLDIVDRSTAANYLSVDIRYDGGYQYDMYRTAEISASIYQEALLCPFFKGFMFLLAAFGIVDIAYNYPKNERIQKKERDYLSVFDGLQYIRLTPLGAFIAGLKKDYAFKGETERATLVLDDKRLLINLDGKDRLKTMILGQLADKISENCFRVTSGSFLKACDTQEDIEGKIRLFRKQVSAKPPRIWEDFLNGILNKIDPLIPEPDLSVFRLKEYPELIELMARDEVLQKYILKAEGYHILISAKNLYKVKKRLETFGYFIHQLR